MVYEARMRSRLEDDYAMLDAASQVIYGPAHDGRGGIDLLLGTSVADCLFWRFCDCRTWSGVADATGRSVAECRRKVAYALDACDALGWASVIEGMGMAEG